MSTTELHDAIARLENVLSILEGYGVQRVNKDLRLLLDAAQEFIASREVESARQREGVQTPPEPGIAVHASWERLGSGAQPERERCFACGQPLPKVRS